MYLENSKLDETDSVELEFLYEIIINYVENNKRIFNFLLCVQKCVSFE